MRNHAKKRLFPYFFLASLLLFSFPSLVQSFLTTTKATTLLLNPLSHKYSHTTAMATQAPNPADVSSLSKDQQLNVHEDSVLADLDVSSSARPIVPPHLLARLSQHDSPDL